MLKIFKNVANRIGMRNQLNFSYHWLFVGSLFKWNYGREILSLWFEVRTPLSIYQTLYRWRYLGWHFGSKVIAPYYHSSIVNCEYLDTNKRLSIHWLDSCSIVIGRVTWTKILHWNWSNIVWKVLANMSFRVRKAVKDDMPAILGLIQVRQKKILFSLETAEAKR